MSKFLTKQKHWLVHKFKVFREHQDRKTTNMLFPSLYEEYHTLWSPTPTAENIEAAGGNAAVVLAKVQKDVERVRCFEFSE